MLYFYVGNKQGVRVCTLILSFYRRCHLGTTFLRYSQFGSLRYIWLPYWGTAVKHTVLRTVDCTYKPLCCSFFLKKKVEIGFKCLQTPDSSALACRILSRPEFYRFTHSLYKKKKKKNKKRIREEKATSYCRTPIGPSMMMMTQAAAATFYFTPHHIT